MYQLLLDYDDGQYAWCEFNSHNRTADYDTIEDAIAAGENRLKTSGAKSYAVVEIVRRKTKMSSTIKPDTFEVSTPIAFNALLVVLVISLPIGVAGIISIAAILRTLQPDEQQPSPPDIECRCADFEQRLKSVEDDVDNLLDMVE